MYFFTLHLWQQVFFSGNKQAIKYIIKIWVFKKWRSQIQKTVYFFWNLQICNFIFSGDLQPLLSADLFWRWCFVFPVPDITRVSVKRLVYVFPLCVQFDMNAALPSHVTLLHHHSCIHSCSLQPGLCPCPHTLTKHSGNYYITLLIYCPGFYKFEKLFILTSGT